MRVFIQRKQSEKTNEKTLDGFTQFWRNLLEKKFNTEFVVSILSNSPLKFVENNDKYWVYTYVIESNCRDVDGVNEVIDENCAIAKWNKYPFFREGHKYFIDPIALAESQIVESTDESTLITFDRTIPWDEFSELALDHVKKIATATDEELGEHEAFKNIYNLEAHIRLIARSIKRAMETSGRVRNHMALWGDPGCGKTSLIKAFLDSFPNGTYITFAADSATKAGYQKQFMQALQQVGGVPPILALEEVDKITDPSTIAPFLSVLDRRGIMEKNTARYAGKIEALSLCIVTANDKEKFDGMLAGAFASRMTKHLKVPLPDISTMRKILTREINEFGGSLEWIPYCIELASELNIHDPRTIISFLEGGDTLYDGSYQKDIKAVMAVNVEYE